MLKILQPVCLAAMIVVAGCTSPSSENNETASLDAADSAGMPPQLPPEIVKMGGLDMERGVVVNSAGSSPGYIMYSSMTSDDVYLIDKEGSIVHVWDGELAAGAEYLMDDGRMIRGARDPEAPRFSAGGMMGRILEFSWDGELLWDYKLANEDYLIHHDIQPLPNGNVLAIVYEHKSPEEVLAAGRTPHTIPEEGLWPDKIIEIKPVRPNGGEIVWEWNAWDHLIQDKNPNLPNYGKVAEHPERININTEDSLHADDRTPEQFQQAIMQGMEAANATAANRGSDIFHGNSIHYNEKLDQIVISTPHLSELWIIDHSTTTKEAAGSTGGRYGKGGDLLYRWGNPVVYGRGTPEDRILGGQHDVRWIPEGYPGAGNLLIFNNNANSADSIQYSEVLEIALPINADGSYNIPSAGILGPEKPVWSYSDKGNFHAPFISSAYRMKNGNTLVNSGPQGRLFEVTPEGEIVWDYWSPHVGGYKLPNGAPPQPAGPLRFAVFRATFIPPDHPALKGKTLAPMEVQAEGSF